MAPNANSSFPSKTAIIIYVVHLTSECDPRSNAIPAIACTSSDAAATSESRDAMQYLYETATKSGIHVAVDDWVVATVGHRQPVECKPEVWQ